MPAELPQPSPAPHLTPPSCPLHRLQYYDLPSVSLRSATWHLMNDGGVPPFEVRMPSLTFLPSPPSASSQGIALPGCLPAGQALCPLQPQLAAQPASAAPSNSAACPPRPLQVERVTAAHKEHVSTAGEEIRASDAKQAHKYFYYDRCAAAGVCVPCVATGCLACQTAGILATGDGGITSIPLLARTQRAPGRVLPELKAVLPHLLPATPIASGHSTHPNDRGHQVLAELLAGLLLQAVDRVQAGGGLAPAARWAAERGEELPPVTLPEPMVPGNEDAPSTLCAIQVTSIFWRTAPFCRKLRPLWADALGG